MLGQISKGTSLDLGQLAELQEAFKLAIKELSADAALSSSDLTSLTSALIKVSRNETGLSAAELAHAAVRLMGQ